MYGEKHTMNRVLCYSWFQASTGSLEMYPLWVRGDYCIVKRGKAEYVDKDAGTWVDVVGGGNLEKSSSNHFRFDFAKYDKARETKDLSMEACLHISMGVIIKFDDGI